MENSKEDENNKESTKKEEGKNKDENGPITPEDLQTPEVKDTENDIKTNENENNKEEKKEEKKEEYNEIISEFDAIFKEIESKDSNKSLFNLCDKFKNKYKEKLIKDSIPIEKEQILINNLSQIFNTYSTNEEYKKIFIEFLFNLYELWPYFYHPNEFEIDIQLNNFKDPLNINNYNELTILDLFCAIKPKQENAMNNLVDKFIMYLYNNYTDYKSLYIENNLLISMPSRSVYVSFKIICLIYISNQFQVWLKYFFKKHRIIIRNLIMNISKMLLQILILIVTIK